MARVASSSSEQGDTSLSGPACSAREAIRVRRLLQAAQAGDRRSREQLATSHLGLVRSVASRYRDLGLPFDDLVQEGSLGLLEAIDRHDPSRGMPFDGYARFRIRRAIRNALTDQARLIRLPKQIVQRRRAIDDAEARLAAEAAGRPPTALELAAATGLSVGAVLNARSAGLAPVSLDAPVLPDGSSLATVVADPQQPTPSSGPSSMNGRRSWKRRSRICRPDSDTSSIGDGASTERQCRTRRSRPISTCRSIAPRQSGETRFINSGQRSSRGRHGPSTSVRRPQFALDPSLNHRLATVQLQASSPAGGRLVEVVVSLA